MTTRTIVSLVYILLPKMVVVLACFAYTRQRSTRDLRLHLLLNVLSVALAPLARVRVRPLALDLTLALPCPNPNPNQVALALALSFVNMGFRALEVRADTLKVKVLERLEELKDKELKELKDKREAGGGGEPSDRRDAYIGMHASLTPPSYLPSSRLPQEARNTAILQHRNSATLQLCETETHFPPALRLPGRMGTTRTRAPGTCSSPPRTWRAVWCGCSSATCASRCSSCGTA